MDVSAMGTVATKEGEGGGLGVALALGDRC